MAVVLDTRGRRYTGLSTDTWPTAGVTAGSRRYETDTGRVYIFDGTAWQYSGDASWPSSF